MSCIRQSNMELLRILAMLMVLFLHANYLSLGGVTPNDIHYSPVNAFIKATLEQLCIVSVNVFVLISGWFGIKPSHKGALSLLYQVFFFSAIITLAVLLIGLPIPLKQALKPFYFGKTFWFVPAYLILYALSPVLNSFIDNASAKQHLSVLISFFSLEFAYGWIITGDGAGFGAGYSAISFVGLYLLARFLKSHCPKVTKLKTYNYFLLYFLTVLFPIGLYFFTGYDFGIINYSSPFVISGAVFLLLGFSKMKIKSKIVNTLAYSSFSIYLIHVHPLVLPHFVEMMKTTYCMLGGGLYIIFVLVFSCVFGLSCVALDKLRILSWNWIDKMFLEKFLVRISFLH